MLYPAYRPGKRCLAIKSFVQRITPFTVESYSTPPIPKGTSEVSRFQYYLTVFHERTDFEMGIAVSMQNYVVSDLLFTHEVDLKTKEINRNLEIERQKLIKTIKILLLGQLFIH